MMESKENQESLPDVTIDQIGRLEHALLAMRTTAKGSPEVLDTIALINYQEIVRLRKELDVALGVEPKNASDLVVSIQGQRVGLGMVPARVVATVLTNIRNSVQSISGFLATGRKTASGRYPSWLSDASDFELAGVEGGSVQLMLNLPKPRTLLPEYEQEPIEKGIKLFLDTVHWVSSTSDFNSYRKRVEDQYLERLLLAQVRRVVPNRNGIVERLEFSGRLATLKGDHVLVPHSANRIRDALHIVSGGDKLATEEGVLRAVDIDRGVFELRQRPDNKPNISCEVADELLPDALNYLIRHLSVIVEGVQKFDDFGRPTRLIVDNIFESGTT